MSDPLKDFDPRTIMLGRCSLLDGFLSDLASHFGWSDGVKAKMIWKMAYRSWRADRRIAAFPERRVVARLDRKSDPVCGQDVLLRMEDDKM